MWQRITALSALAALIPQIASAEVVSVAVGTFNIFVGVMLVLSFILMGAGWIIWVVRLGTWPTYRDDAIHLMEYSVVLLFVVGLLLLISQFVQMHTGFALFLIGLVIAGFILWLVFQVVAESQGKEDEDGA